MVDLSFGNYSYKDIHRFYTTIKWSLEQQIEWLKENIDLWGYEECPRCKGKIFTNIMTYTVTGKPVGDICDYCNGTGKIKIPALKYLDEVER